MESLTPAFLISDAPCTLPPGMKGNNGPTGRHLHHQSTSEYSYPAHKVIGPRAPVTSPKEKPTSPCPAGKAGRRRIPVRVPQENLLPQSGKPESITLPRASDTVTSSYMSQPSSSSSYLTSSNRTPTTLISKLNPVPVYKPDTTPILRPKAPFHLAVFIVRTLLQIDQQSCLARTLETLHVDVCCISETRIQNPTPLIHLRSPRSPAGSELTLRVSSEPASSPRGYAGVGIAFSTRAEKALPEWIPINSRLCAIGLHSSIAANKQRNAKRHLFIVSAYAPTDCSNDETKDSFYRELSNPLRSAKQRDLVVLAGDINAQVGRIASSGKRLGSSFGIQTNRTDNGDRLLQLCTDHKLYLISTNFKHKKRQTVTWRSNKPAHLWTQIDHIPISYRWRGSAEDCRSFWNTCIDSDHTLLRSRINLRLTENKLHAKVPSNTLSEAPKHTYQSGLVTHLSISDNVSHPNDA